MSISRTPTGGMLLCRTEPLAARSPAHLLRVRLLLAPAGAWTVLVPEDKPWLDGGASVGEVFSGWGSAVAVGTNWPVLGLWWEGGRAGFSLAGGFRRTVAQEWDAAGRPAGEPGAMRTLAARLGLDPVLDLEELERLTRPDPEPEVDGGTRLRGLVALLTRAGLTLPPGLTPGEPADRLRGAARVAPGAETVEWSGWRDAVRAELDAVEAGPLGPWVHGPKARLLGAAQVAAGAPLLVWAARRRSPAWAAAGALLLAQGTLSLAYDRARARR
ncbi:membrane protein [Streptomyces sp. H021]|nr:membrane protein [Streptomyces sp. H021]